VENLPKGGGSAVGGEDSRASGEKKAYPRGGGGFTKKGGIQGGKKKIGFAHLRGKEVPIHLALRNRATAVGNFIFPGGKKK